MQVSGKTEGGRKMIYLTAGESHGPQLTGIIEDFRRDFISTLTQSMTIWQNVKAGTAAATASRLNMTRFRSSAE